MLSAGPADPNHPHPDVLRQLQEHGLRVYGTCWPEVGEGLNTELPYGLPLPGLIPDEKGTKLQLRGFGWGDLEVGIWSDGQVTVEPAKSRLV